MANDQEPRDPLIVCLADSIIEPRHAPHHAPHQAPDRRLHMRRSPADVRWLRDARFKYGRSVRVLDISAGGIRVESGNQLVPQRNVVFEFAGPDSSILMPAKVLRSLAAGHNEALCQGACQFKWPLDVPELATPAKALLPQEDLPPARRPPAGQNVVARLRDGRVLRGHTMDFHPSKPQLHLFTEPHSTDTTRLSLAHLEAVFFMRDGARDPDLAEHPDYIAQPRGRNVIVTFRDGQTLSGSTLGYRGERDGFFVQPADASSNILRVFVMPAATQHVRFL